MATVDVAVSSDLSPERAWVLASDLRRFDEWLTIFGGWRSEVPSQVEVGTCVSSLIKVKGFRNVIHWCVTRYDEPKEIELVGRGRPAICIALRLCVKEIRPGPENNVASGPENNVASGSENNVASGSENNVASGSENNVASGSENNVASGSVFQVVADLTGGLLNTRIGKLVAKVLESDVRKSVTNLAALR
jgi:polyketide cyclase/dehydrase/lipid transport protein